MPLWGNYASRGRVGWYEGGYGSRNTSAVGFGSRLDFLASTTLNVISFKSRFA